MSGIAWFTGVCDQILARVERWYLSYERGGVYASRNYLGHDFTQRDVPVLFAHEIPWRLGELKHLVTILKAVKPDWVITKDFGRLLGIVQNRALWKRYEGLLKIRGDLFVITLVFEKPDLNELVALLKEVRDGKPVTNEDLLVEKRNAGKDIWET
jgi:hypothetical protein